MNRKKLIKKLAQLEKPISLPNRIIEEEFSIKDLIGVIGIAILFLLVMIMIGRYC